MKVKIRSAIKYICYHGWLNWIPDRQYLEILFSASLGQKLNLSAPKSYNEKLQWIKLNDRKKEYSAMVDKVAVRSFIKSRIGAEYLIPSIGIWSSPDEIDFDSLPNQFVLKCNHNSGKGMCICKDKSKLDISAARRKLKEGLKERYYLVGREWPYKNVKPKILGEQYMVDESGVELKDYKVMCFEGEPKLIELHMGRFTNHQTQDFYDIKWNKTDISQGNDESYGMSNIQVERPDCLDEMLELSRKLATGIHHLRVDWYVINGKLYFGELTFFDGSGFVPYDNPDNDLLLGSWIKLPCD